MATLADSTIGRNLSRLREARGMTRAALAQLVNIDEPALALYEEGEARLPPALVYDLATAINVPISALFELADMVGTPAFTECRPRVH